MRKKKGTFLMILGLLLLAAAFCLTGYNIYESKKAKSFAENTVREIWQVQESVENGMQETLLYEKFPDMEMPTMEIDGQKYCGILEIPVLGLSLPVMAGEWSYPKLRRAPCVYSGSVYKDDFVIAAHNYDTHFGRIKNIDAGSEIRFTDAEGNTFSYIAGWLDVLQPDEIEVMTNASDWDMTLFTCTYGGRERFALRCVREK